MTTKRMPIDRPSRSEITPKILTLFARAVEIEDVLGGAWNAAHGTRKKHASLRAEHLRIRVKLHHALGLMPWDDNVLYVADEGTPAWMSAEAAVGYRKVQGIRRALWDALEPGGPV